MKIQAMKIYPAVFFIFVILFAITATAQTIAVNPTGVNVNSQNPTTVFLTFGQIPANYFPAEAFWCGELIAATPPALGQQCRPDTIYGALPARINRSTSSGNGGFTDIMGIPSAVVRRAYLAAAGGASAGFFYVRRFVSTTGQPDQFVNVTCRMTSGGARVPFALTNVEIRTPDGEPVLFLRPGEKLPEIEARIQFNGTGRLKGRWEIVTPGEELPEERDLLTEATLPLEQRGTQKRYTRVAAFNHFLPPTGTFSLKLKTDARRILTAAGQYLLILRVEAVNDKESDSNLSAIGVGNGIVHSGAVASFPMPVLKIFLAAGDARASWSETALGDFGTTPQTGVPQVFMWRALDGAAIYKLEIVGEAGAVLFSAIIRAPSTSYAPPPWLVEKVREANVKWSVTAMDKTGKELSRTAPKALEMPVR